MSGSISAPSTSAATWEASSLLRAYYLAVYRPAAIKRFTSRRIERYDSALRRFEKFVGGRPQLGAVTHELLTEFTAALRSRRCSEPLAKDLARCIRAIIREWDGSPVPRIEPLPAAEPGTLRHYFEHTYAPEVMFDCLPASVNDTRRAVRALHKHVGRDTRIDELSDALVAGFLQALVTQGKPATTVNKYRATLLAVWNHAFEGRLIDRAPRVKKLREVRHVPDAWSIDEMVQILAAARRFRSGWSYGKSRTGRIRCDRFWPALLLVAYDTGLRRGALLAIRQPDVDLKSGWLHADGNNSKSLKGQAFRLSPETLAALGEIWDPPRDRVFDYAKVRQVDKHFSLISEAAGIRPSRRKGLGKFHKVRRTTATMIAARAGLAAAAAHLGHSDQETSKRYIDPTQLQHDATSILPALSLVADRPAVAG